MPAPDWAGSRFSTAPDPREYQDGTAWTIPASARAPRSQYPAFRWLSIRPLCDRRLPHALQLRTNHEAFPRDCAHRRDTAWGLRYDIGPPTPRVLHSGHR